MELKATMERKTKLLSALRRELRLSDGLIRRLKPLGVFRVNGVSAHTNHPLNPGDLVSVSLEEAPPDFPAEEGPLEILYEPCCRATPTHRRGSSSERYRQSNGQGFPL